MKIIPNEALNNLILVFFAIFYVAFVFYQRKQKNFPFFHKVFNQEPLKRLPFFDYAKGVAILAIFILNTSYLLSFFNEKLPSYFLEWNQLINRFAAFAVPVFLISSGALLTLPNLKINSLKAFYISKLKRLFVPYIIFSLPAVYLLFTGEWRSHPFVSLLILPFWFIPLLLQLYFIYPGLWYFLIIKKIKPVWLLFSAFIFSLGCYFLSVFWPDWPFGSSFFGLFIFFFVLGMILRPILFLGDKKWLKKIYFPFWSILVIIFYFGIGSMSPQEKYFNCQFIYGPVVFLLLFYFFNWFSRLSFTKFIQKIGENSLYFYLIHSYVLVFLINMASFFNLFYINPFILFIGLFVFGFLITYFLVFGVVKFFINNLFKFHNN